MNQLDSSRLIYNPKLARIIESGRSNLPSGITATGSLSAYAQQAVATIRDNRDRKKVEIAELNNRLAQYIEKVRFLEAQNRVVLNDIGLFRQAAHIHSERITVYYVAEKNSLATLVRENSAKVSSAQQNIRKLEPEIANAVKNWKHSIELRQHMRSEKKEFMKRFSNIEAETAYVKRLINDSDDEKHRLKTEISRIRAEIKRVMTLQEKERNGIARTQSSAQDLLKKLNGTITQHEIAIREEINKARRDSTDKNKDYFHRELQQAISQIRDKFDSDSKKTRKAWQEWYKKKTSEIKKYSDQRSVMQNNASEEVLKIRSTVYKLRTKITDADALNKSLIGKIEDIKYREDEELRMMEIALSEKERALNRMREEATRLRFEIDKLIENQINLTNEVSHYRKLIENAENIQTTVPSFFVINTPAPLMRKSYHRSNESIYSLSARNIDEEYKVHSNYDYSNHSVISSNQFQSYSKGDLVILEHEDESIVLQNQNTYKSKDISNWKIHHYQDGSLVGMFIFPVSTHIHPQEKLSIHSQKSSNLLNDMVAPKILNFNFNRNTKTVLYDDADEEIGWYAHVTYNH